MIRITRKDASTFFRFGLSGLPGFVLAIGANILLIEIFHVRKPLAYAFIMWLQMSIGFVMCRLLVFSRQPGQGLLPAYLQFAASMTMIRVADWTLYTFLVQAGVVIAYHT